MAKDRNASPRRRLLDAWEPPRDAGEPIGVIATTFTLDTALFEEECLSRFVGVQSHPVRDGALYRIERDERLAQLRCAAVLADIHHCAGQRSLRWDLLAARPAQGVMHAKVSLLAWRDHVRFIVASANLTSDGYRRNQECFAVLDFSDQGAEQHLWQPLVQFLSQLVDLATGAARQRAVDLLDWVGRRLPRHEPRGRGPQRHVVLVGPGRASVFEQLAAVLPRGTIDEAHVVSPFFNPAPREDGPERELWRMMRARGAAEVHYHVAAEELSNGAGWRLQMPGHVLSATPKNRDVASRVHPIDVAHALGDAGVERRPLHAKTLTLASSGWLAALVGSSNFTSPGTAQPNASNWEANVLYVLKGDEKSLAGLRVRMLRGGRAVDPASGVEFEPAFGDGEGEDDTPACLPAFFACAELMATSESGYEIALAFSGPPPAWPWAVHHEGALLIESQQWVQRGAPSTVAVTVPRTARPPSVLQVTCGDAQGVVEWPVACRSAEAVPPPEGVPQLTLAALMELLASGKPLHEALRAYLRSLPTDDDDTDAAMELLDPHAKVDASGFLMKRVQQACWTFVHLRRRLCEPIASAQALDWRLNGPLGARAVLRAMEAACDPALPDERAFLACEFAREMRSVKLAGAGGEPVPADAAAAFAGFLAELKAAAAGAAGTCSSTMQQYVRDAMEADA